MREFTSIILAAGMGTRMKSQLPKVLHKVCGKELVSWVIDASKKAGAKKVVAVSTKIVHVMRKLWKGNTMKLTNIFKEAHDRSELVATFLAVLELCKVNRVKIDGDGEEMTVALNKERKSSEH